MWKEDDVNKLLQRDDQIYAFFLQKAMSIEYNPGTNKNPQNISNKILMKSFWEAKNGDSGVKV